MIGLLLVALQAPTGHAYDSYMSGNMLLSICETNKAVCTAYIGGVADFLDLIQTRGDLPHKVCVPTNSSLGQVADVVIKALRDQPATRHHGAAGLVSVAIADAFPCPKM